MTHSHIADINNLKQARKCHYEIKYLFALTVWADDKLVWMPSLVELVLHVLFILDLFECLIKGCKSEIVII